MVTIAICDDEATFRRQVEEMLAEISAEQKVPLRALQFATPAALLAAREVYDVLLLDIVLEHELTGIHVGKILRARGVDIPIIIMTNHPAYWQEGYTIGAFRYLLKPFTPQQLWANLCAAIQQKQGMQPKVRVTSNYVEKLIPIHKIVYVESYARKRKIVLVGDEVVETHTPIPQLREDINQSCFLEPQRGFLVNANHIDSLSRTGLTLVNGEIVNISRKYKAQFYRDLNHWLAALSQPPTPELLV